ncbi:hypothetical protein ABXJ76_17240 [Methylobacter sp. G7]
MNGSFPVNASRAHAPYRHPVGNANIAEAPKVGALGDIFVHAVVTK